MASPYSHSSRIPIGSRLRPQDPPLPPAAPSPVSPDASWTLNLGNVPARKPVLTISQEKPLPRQPLKTFSAKHVSTWGAAKTTSRDIPSWKPFTIRMPFVSFLIVIVIGFIVGIEFMYQRTQRKGAVTFSLTEDLEGWQTFVSQYMGTIAAVIFSILLSMVDLDAKRLEPWFQLSSPAGATAASSLLLCYPFDFVATVPFKALRRKHWSVFFVGTATVLVFWFITPLQSALLATVTKGQEHPAEFRITQRYEGARDNKFGTPSFLGLAFGLTWFNTSLPAFATRSIAALPFEPLASSSWNGSANNKILWSGRTSVFYPKLNCAKAESYAEWNKTTTSKRLATGRRYMVDLNSTYYYFYDKETGYNSTRPVAIVEQTDSYKDPNMNHSDPDVLDDPPRIYYPTPLYDLDIHASLEESDQWMVDTFNKTVKVKAKKHMLLAYFAYQAGVNVTNEVYGVLCKPTYYRSMADVIIDAQTKEIQNYTLIGSPETLDYRDFDLMDKFAQKAPSNRDSSESEDEVFNGPFATAPLHDSQIARLLEQYGKFTMSREDELGGITRKNPFLGYVLANEPELPKYRNNPDVYIAAITKAFEMVFMSYVVSNSLIKEVVPTPTEGRIGYWVTAVVVPEVFARILQSLLSVVLLLLLGFVVVNWNRPTGLIYDPASLAGTMSLVANDTKLLSMFRHFDGESSIQDVAADLSKDSTRFALGREYGHYQISVLKTSKNFSKPSIPTPSNSSVSKEPLRSDQERNIELSAPVGTAFILILAGLLAFLSVLFTSNNTYHGLPGFPNRVVVFQIVYSYLPTAIATLMEPFWILLARFLCVIQPLETLRKGHARASEALTLKFESLPPYLTAITALGSGHYFLAILGLTAFSTNIFAIALGAMFDLNLVQEYGIVTFNQTFKPKIIAFPMQTDPWTSEWAGVKGPDNPTKDSHLGYRDHGFVVGENDHWNLLWAKNATQGTPLSPWTTASHFFLPFEIPSDAGQSDRFQSETYGMNASLICEKLPRAGRVTRNHTVYYTIYENAPVYTWDSLPLEAKDNPNENLSPREKKINCAFISTDVQDTPDGGYEQYRSYDGYPLSHASHTNFDPNRVYEIDDPDLIDPDVCGSLLPVVIVRSNSTEVPEEEYTEREQEMGTTDDWKRSSYGGILCRPHWELNTFQVTVDRSQQVKEVVQKEKLDFNMLFPKENGTTTQWMLLSSIRARMTSYNSHVSFDSSDPWSWLDVFLRAEMNTTAGFDPELPIPDLTEFGKAMSRVYTKVFTGVLASYTDRMFERYPAAEPAQVIGIKETRVQKAQMSTPMFMLAAALLGWYTLVAIYFYLFRVSRFFKQLPTSIASEIQLVHGSAALADVRGTEYLTSRQRELYLAKLNKRYGYGRFVGPDETLRVGVEREPLLDHFRNEHIKKQGLGRLGVGMEQGVRWLRRRVKKDSVEV